MIMVVKLSYRKLVLILLFIVSSPLYSVRNNDELPAEAQEWLYEFNYDKLNDNIICFEYRKNIYIPLNTILNDLKIFSEYGISQTTRGYFLNTDSTFEVNLQGGFIKRGDVQYPLDTGDFIANNLEVFVKSPVFNKLFDFNIEIKKTELKIILKSDIILPVLSAFERNQKKLKNMKNSQEEKSSGPLLNKQKFSLIDFNNLHYRLGMNKQTSYNSYNFDLTLNAVLMGGDLFVNTIGNYYASQNQLFNQYYFSWKKIFKENDFLSQIKIGNIYTNSKGGANISSKTNSSNAIYGIRISNEPNRQRSYFTDIVYNEYVGTNWQGELYINNQLYSQTYSDKNGNISLNAPIQYGTTRLKLNYYGPYGETKTIDKEINVSSDFIKPGTIRYNLSGGLDINNNDLILSTNITTGITTWFTNTVYLYNNFDNNKLSFQNHSALRLFGDYLLNLIISPENFYSGTINFQTDNFGRYEFSFLNQIDGTNKYFSFDNYRADLRIFVPRMTFLPVNISFRGFRYVQDYKTINNLYANLGFQLFDINVSTSYNYSYSENKTSDSQLKQSINSSFNYGFNKKPAWLSFLGYTGFNGGLYYDINANELVNVNLSIHQSINDLASFNVNWQKNLMNGESSVNCGLYFNFGFIQSNSSVQFSDDGYSLYQNVNGNISYNSAESRIEFNRPMYNESNSSDISIRFFVDNNMNGMFDDDEEIIKGVGVEANGLMSYQNPNSDYTVLRSLEPYKHYRARVNYATIKNPLIKPKFEEFSVEALPSSRELIDIPCYMTGSVDGQVVIKKDSTEKGQSGLKIHLKNLASGEINTIKVFSDGSFYQMGIMPGDYSVYVDSIQLKLLKCISDPADNIISIGPSGNEEEGSGLLFELLSEPTKPVNEKSFEKATDVKDISLSSSSDNPPSVAVSKQQQNSPAKAALSFPVYLHYSNPQVTAVDKQMISLLDKLVAYLRDNPDTRIIIAGNSYSFDTAGTDKSIPRKRADNVCKYLTDGGIDRDRILTYGNVSFIDKSALLSDDSILNGKVEISISK